jgi:hypothetical protein
MTNSQQSERKLDEALQALPAEILPERDLWPAISARVDDHAQGAQQNRSARSHKRSGRLAGLRRLAAVLALAVAGVLGWRILLLPEAPIDNFTGLTLTSELALMNQYEQQKAGVLADLERIPEPFEDWRRQLAIWDQAVDQVRVALEYYPEEPELLNQMESLYQQQMDYLHLIAAVDKEFY